AKAVSWAIIIQTLPWFFMTPLAGHTVDRFSRRRLMILADVIRGFVVLGLLLVRSRSEVWLVYVLLGLEVIFASFFEPARSALLPQRRQRGRNPACQCALVRHLVAGSGGRRCSRRSSRGPARAECSLRHELAFLLCLGFANPPD